MIPLRIIHVVPPRRMGAATVGALTLARWLHSQGHAQAVAPPATCLEGVPEGIDVLPWKMHPIGWVLGGRDRMVRALAAWTPDLIHVHDPALVGWALAVGRRLRLPVVASLVGGWRGPGARRLRDRRLAKVLVPTEVHRSEAVTRLGIDRERVAVLPIPASGVPASRPVDGRLVLGTEAGDGRGRGIAIVLSSLARLRRDGVVARAVIGVDDARAAARVAELGRRAQVGDHVVVLVDTGAADLARRCDVVVVPGPGEPCPLLLAEAQAAGRPVVAAGIGGAAELIQPGGSGLLVAPGDAAAVESALDAIADAVRRSAMGACGRRWASQRFAPPVVAAAALDLYRGAIGDRDTAGRLASCTAYRRAATRTRTTAG